MPSRKNIAWPATVLTIAIALILSPLKSFSQENAPPRADKGKKTIFYDPFFSAGNFINPAGNFKQGSAWASISAKPNEGSSSPSVNFRQDGKRLGGMLRMGVDFSQPNSSVSSIFMQQAMLYACINAGKKVSLFPLASYEFGLRQHKIGQQGFMLGAAAFYDWKILGLSGYAGYASETGKQGGALPAEAAGKGAVAGLGWSVRKNYMEVRHMLDIDFRTGARRISVETAFMHFGVLYESVKTREGKAAWLGARANLGNGASANCLSLWAKAGCEGGISFRGKWQPVAGLTLKHNFPAKQRQPVAR